MAEKSSALVTSAEPFEAFWHERFGTMIVLKVTTVPDMRDYAYVRLKSSEAMATACVDGFLTGFNGRKARDE